MPRGKKNLKVQKFFKESLLFQKDVCREKIGKSCEEEGKKIGKEFEWIGLYSNIEKNLIKRRGLLSIRYMKKVVERKKQDREEEELEKNRKIREIKIVPRLEQNEFGESEFWKRFWTRCGGNQEKPDGLTKAFHKKSSSYARKVFDWSTIPERKNNSVSIVDILQYVRNTNFYDPGLGPNKIPAKTKSCIILHKLT